jgi:osmotically-inducible protein OsmY
MADYRQQRHSGRNDPRGFDDRDDEAHGGQVHDYERDRERSFGGSRRGSSRDRMGAEQFRPQDSSDYGEQSFRDYGRGQPGGAYEHSGKRDYRHGSGYGGFGEGPGESGGGFGSGRSYAAEPGWGPAYGQYGGYQGQGSYPGSYGTQRGPFDGPGRRSEDRLGRAQFGQERRRDQPGQGYRASSQGFDSRGMGTDSYGHGPLSGQGFGEAGHTDAQQGFSQRRYAGESSPPRGHREQSRHGRGPKGYQRSDERLKEDISERLMSAACIDAREVTVAVEDGKVILQGTVTERRMKHRIEDMVDDCMGVKDIDNRIRVVHDFAGSETTLSVGGGQGSGGRQADAGGSGSGGSGE